VEDEQREFTQSDTDTINELTERINYHVNTIIEFYSLNGEEDPFEAVYDTLSQTIAHMTILYSVLRKLEERLHNVS